MDAKNQLCSIARMVLPLLGFTLICVGAYLVSLQSSDRDYTLIIYVLVVCGFLAMLTGIIWVMCHGMRSKMYQHRRRQNRRGRVDQQIHVYTIDRPSCFPPSYEESEQSRVVSPDRVRDSVVVVVVGEEGEGAVSMSRAPPLYTQDSSEIPDDTLSWERPPPYSHIQTVPPRRADTEQQQETAARHCPVRSSDLD